MECPSCHSEMPDDSRFCEACGAALPVRCASCGRPNRPDAKFCAECGEKLSAATPETTAKPVMAPAAPAFQAAGSAERRHLTVMFVDLVGSTALSARLDPEDMREMIGAYHRCCTEQITKAGGFVAKYMGDGVLVYFGYPQAHEDDAERAVRAALALTEAVPKLPATHGAVLQVRIGISTGLVVVGDLIGEGDAQERGVVGEAPNLAARLQALAEPGQVVISHGTRRLTGGLFDYRDLGRVALKGVSSPVQAWQILGASGVESRFEAQRGTSLTPLVGREEELELLLRRWQRAKVGDGSVVLVSGEPGIGKSRIIHALLERLGAESYTRMRQFCSPYHQNSALFPTISHFERAAGFRRDDTDEHRLEKLEGMLARATNELGAAAPLLANLLSIQTGNRYPPLELSPQKRKEKTLKALMAQLEGLAARQPVIMVYEDAQWIDPTSLELLDLTVDRVPSLPVLLIITFRPEFTPPWVGRPNVTMLSLTRLTPRQRAEMIMRITSGKALPQEITAQIIERTDGVPLFVEELTKAVVEIGMVADAGDRYSVTGPSSPLAIPATLQASLLARLDRLAPVREVVQIGAAIGRQFSHELITAVARMPARQLDDALDQLVAAELIYRRGTPPDAEYTFKHALVQDAAYSTLLRSRRQQIHGRITATLERQFREIVDTQPELLARHCAEAGLAAQAIEYYTAAAARAAAASNGAEAMGHLTKGLALVEMLPSSAQHSCELRLQIALGASIIGLKGYGAPEVETTFARARELCADLGDSTELFHSLAGLRAYHLVRARLNVASDFCQQLSELASRLDDPKLKLSVHHIETVNSFYTGHLTDVPHHCEHALALYDPQRRSKRGISVADVAVESLCHCAHALWALGYPDRASEKMAAATALTRRTGNLFSLCIAMHFETYLYLKRREPELTAEPIKVLSTVAKEHGFAFWSIHALIWECWHAICVKGERNPDDLELLRKALAEVRVQGSDLVHPFWSTMLVRCLAARGETAEAVELLDNAIAEVVRVGSVVWEPEFLCLVGDLLRSHDAGMRERTERSYYLAMEAAQHQSAKMWELRASTSLARLWRDQGKRTEARDLLAPIYGWFTEGFDTPDLKEAKTLLDELA